MFRLITKISWASLKRRRVRSFMVMLMICLSLWGLVFMEGIYDGMVEQMIANAIRSDCGHITLFAKDYRLDKEITKLIPNAAILETNLRNDPRVKGVNARILQDGLVATAHYSKNCMVVGVDLFSERANSRLDTYLTEGKFDFGKKSRGVIIGSKLAKKLKVTIGKKLIISAQDVNNDVSSLALKVTGILRTNNMWLDEVAVFIHREKTKKMLGIHDGLTQFSLLLHKQEDIQPLQKELKEKLPTLDVFRWDEMYPALLQSRVMMIGFNMVCNIIVFCIAGLGIFGVMLVSVMERLREFGILLAVGTGFAHIRLMVAIESLFLGCVGFVGGSLLGGISLYYFQENGLDLTIFDEGLEAFGIDTIIYSVIKPEYFIYSFAAVVLATLVSIIIPLRILKKSKPIEAIQKI